MAVPTITSLTPASGPPAGGTLVDVVGTGLDTVSAASFGATPAASLALISATRLALVSPAGTGTASLTVTNPDGTSNALAFTFSGDLFTLAEARAYVHRGQALLADAVTYPDAAIEDAHDATRSLFESACRVAFVPTLVTETLDGASCRTLRVSKQNPALESPQRPLTVTAASIDGTPLTATELSYVKAHPDGRLVRTDGGTWSSSTGYQDLAVSITYTHGWATVPALIKEAALRLVCVALVGSDVPESAVSMSDGGATFQFARPGMAPHWTGIDYVDARLDRMRENRAVIA